MAGRHAAQLLCACLRDTAMAAAVVIRGVLHSKLGPCCRSTGHSHQMWNALPSQSCDECTTGWLRHVLKVWQVKPKAAAVEAMAAVAMPPTMAQLVSSMAISF